MKEIKTDISNIKGTGISFARKKFRFSDWFSEKLIKAVAFMSIAFVALIFIFVFREAFPVFRMDAVQKATTETLVPEKYGDEPALNSDNDKTNPVSEISTAKPSSTLLGKDWVPVSDILS